MKLKYETGVAAFVQFIVLSFLNIANGLNSVVTDCRSDSGECVGNIITSLIFYIIIVSWFGAVWMLAYAAQQSRNKMLARLLIAAEFMIAIVALFNAKHHTDLLGLFTSVVDLLLAIWVITLAVRLLRSKGQRITGRTRRRRVST